MTRYSEHVNAVKTNQKDQARADQVVNSAGGYVFEIDMWKRLDRWLILGAEGNTYYASEKEMVKKNAKSVQDCLDADGERTVNRIVEISDAGRAPKNDPAIFALAMAAGHSNPAVRKAALAALPKVCRIGTHLFHFAQDVESFRHWGKGLRNAVAAWYTQKPVDKLAHQLVKYRQRDGWSHKDLLRLSHPVAPSNEHNALFRYVVGGVEAFGERTVLRRKSDKTTTEKKYTSDIETLPAFIMAFERLQVSKDKKEVCQLIRDHGFTHEMLPTEWKNHVEIWEAILEEMPQTALIRNLAKMTEVGLLKPMSAASKKVIAQLGDADKIRKARVHPITMLSALKIYERGHGERGSLTWSPVPQIVDALNEGFYLSFKGIEPSGKNRLLALDVSGSMTTGEIAGVPGLTPRVASAAMAMVTARVEKNWHIIGFTCASGGYGGKWGGGEGGITDIPITPSMRLDTVIQKIDELPMGGTDCALPMVWAKENKIEVDSFEIYTDNETWHGNIHPFQAVRDYRRTMGRNSKVIVVGMLANPFTIADPSDAGMLDVVGFDSAAPAIMSDFVKE